MGGLCCCFRAREEHAVSAEPNSRSAVPCHGCHFFNAFNALFQRGHIRPVSSATVGRANAGRANAGRATAGRATVVPSPSDDSSIPDTYRPPPRPLPFDDPRCSHLQPQSGTTASMLGKVSSQFHEASQLRQINNDVDPIDKLEKPDIGGDSKKNLSELPVKQPPEQAISGCSYFFAGVEDEDDCPTCFEEYTLENPKITLQCSHHFHLSCIYEWRERSEMCPFCRKVMLFNESE